MAFSLFNQKKTSSNRGFTLIELIVVIAIIAILSVLIGFSIIEMIKRGKVALAQGELNRIAKAIRQLEVDTNRSSNYETLTGCVSGSGTNEFSITSTDVRSGLYSAVHPNGTYTGWKGPYLEAGLVDPWGNPYRYDGDYYCHQTAESKKAKGCEKYQTAGASGYQRAIVSLGPSGGEAYDADNVVLVLCVKP